MLKKFTDFTTEKKKEVVSTTQTQVQKPKVIEPKAKIPKVKIPKGDLPSVDEVETPKNESIKPKFDFNGKIVSMPSNIKPSVSIVMLENNKISKDKLHYIISSQTKDSLVVLKYNKKAEIKLTEFTNTLIDYYKLNETVKNIFDEIVVEGTKDYTIIKNIPDLLMGGEKLINVLNKNIIKLLK